MNYLDLTSKDLKVVVVNSPYDQWSNPIVRELFTNTVGLKINSYGKFYPMGTIPVDTTDFVGTHLLICIEEFNKIKPIATYRSITWQRCMETCLNFPLQNILETSNALDHLSVLKEIMNNHEKNPSALVYQSGWAIDAQVKENRTLVKDVKDIMTAIVALNSWEEGIKETVGAGSTLVKADKYFASWGASGFSINGTELPNVKMTFYHNVEAKIITIPSSYSSHTHEQANRWKAMWDSRMAFDFKNKYELNAA